MVISRRELPRTSRASWDRLGRTRILLSRAPRPPDRPLRGDGDLPLRGDPDRPDETDELTRDRGDHMRHRFASSQEPPIARMQAMLGLPGNLDDMRGLATLSGAQRIGAFGWEAIRPGGFQQDASEMGVAGFGDRAAVDAAAARVLAGHGAAVAHELPRMREARQRTELTYDGRGGHLAHAAQTLQRTHDRLHRRRRGRDRAIQCRLESLKSRPGVVHFVDVISERRLLRRRTEGHGIEPAAMALGLRLHARRRSNAVAQQKLADAMAGSELIGLRGLTRAQQISQSFMRRVGDPYGREIAGTMTAREPLGVAAIGLDAVAGLDRHEGRGDDVTGYPQFGQLPVEHVPTGPGFVAGAQMLPAAELADQFGDGRGLIGNHAEAPDLTARLGDGDSDAWTSRPKYRRLLVIDRLLSHVALRGSVAPTA